MIGICRRRRLRKPVEEAYLACRSVCEPDILSNPDEANLQFMRSESRDLINLLHRQSRAVSTRGGNDKESRLVVQVFGRGPCEALELKLDAQILHAPVALDAAAGPAQELQVIDMVGPVPPLAWEMM